MDIRLRIGRYAGEIRDIAPDEARQMIADGRAEDPRLDDLDRQEVPKKKPAKKQ